MALTVLLPRALYPYARGTGALRLEEQCLTVGAALSAVRQRWPGVVDRVMTERGEVREHVNIFVGDESIRFADGLDTRVTDGDTIMIVAAVSGG
jgi:molybdopterin synthase sulfur carrier subunit